MQVAWTPSVPATAFGRAQGYLTLQWGVSEPCKERNGEISGSFPAPSPPAWEEIGCRFRACEAPDLCGSQTWLGGSDGHPSLQSTACDFSPIESCLNRINPDAYSLHAYRVDGILQEVQL